MFNSKLLIVLLVPCICFADQGPVKIREFKYYREFLIGKNTLLLSKKNQLIVFNSGKKRLILSKFSKFSMYTFNEFQGDIDRFVFFKTALSKKSSIGLYSRKSSIFFKSDCDVSNSFKKNLDQMISSEFLDKVQQMKVTNLFDEKSCSKVKPEQFDKFKKVLINALSAQRLSFAACFKSKYAQDIFGKDMLLLQNSAEVFGRYLDLIDQISADNSSLKIKCGLPEGQINKVASFSENPLVIALNTVNQEFNLGLTDISEAVDHELLHYGVRQFETEKNSKCMNEGFTELFEAACKYKPDVGIEIPPSGEEVRNKCLNNESTKIQLQKNAENGGDQGIEVVAQVANLPLENRAENQAGTEQLVAAANSGKPMFEPVPEAAVQVLASAPVLTTTGQPISAFEGDGQYHAVVADSVFTQSVQAVESGLSASANNLSGVLGGAGMAAAAVIVGNRAVASTSGTVSGGSTNVGSGSSAGSGSVAPMTSTEVFLNRYYPDDNKVQAVLDQPKLDKMTYSEKEAYFRSLAPSAATVATAGDGGGGAAVTKTSLAAVKTEKMQASKTVTPGATGSRSIASVEAPQAVQVDDEKSPKVKTESSAVAQTGVAVTQNANPPTMRLDNAIIQRLSVFKDVREPAYTRVTERFNDPVFQQQLDARHIQILDEKGNRLWKLSPQVAKNANDKNTAESQAGKKCFRDNKTTKVIEKIPCK